MSWDKLTMGEKALYMRSAIKNGYRDMESIKEKYNEFAEGGNLNAIFTVNPEDISTQKTRYIPLKEVKDIDSITEIIDPTGVVKTKQEVLEKYPDYKIAVDIDNYSLNDITKNTKQISSNNSSQQYQSSIPTIPKLGYNINGDFSYPLNRNGENTLNSNYYRVPNNSSQIIPTNIEFDLLTLGALPSNTKRKVVKEISNTTTQILPARQFTREYPELYRKLAPNRFPEVNNGKVMIGNNSARWDGDTNIYTNFTTDVPVRSHKSGNWDSMDTYIVNPNRILDKNTPISTRPADTFFTTPNQITTDIKDIILISGNPASIKAAKKEGIKVLTNKNLKLLYKKETQNAKKEQLANPKFNTYKENWNDYSKEVENIIRKKRNTPTLQHYNNIDNISDNVLYKSEVLDYSNFYKEYDKFTKTNLKDFNSDNFKMIEKMQDVINTNKGKSIIDNKNNFRNVVYDPYPSVEYDYRKIKGFNIDNYKK